MNAHQWWVAAACLALVLAGVSGQANAVIAESNTYPGLECIKDEGGSDHYYTDGSIANGAVTEMTVVCPFYKNDDNGSVAGIEIYRVDNWPGSTFDVSCQARCNDDLSGTYSSTSWDASGTVLSLGSLSDYDDGHCFLYCNIPPVFSGAASSIANYVVDYNE